MPAANRPVNQTAITMTITESRRLIYHFKTACSRLRCIVLFVVLWGESVSAEDCILYRKIGDDWCVLGYGFTFSEAELDDYEFRKASTVVPFKELFEHLERLNAKYVTEFGVCYAGEFILDVPPEVPQKHRVLCCIPDSERDE